MLGIVIATFIGLNLVSTIIVLAACVVSGRAERCIDEQEAVAVQHVQLNEALNKLRTVEPHVATGQA